MFELRQALEKTRASWRRLFPLLDKSVDEGVWQELEELLISADVGVTTTAQLLKQVKERVRQGLSPGQALQQEIARLLTLEVALPPPITPWVVLMVGVNGSGKTTSLAKLAYKYIQEGNKVLLAAADTFRAAAVEQLQEWGRRLDAEVIAQRSGADPGAVVFDAMEAAHHRGAGVVLIDTAGRLHTKYNLMEELKKIKRVASRRNGTAPHQVILVLDATTGQNGLAQAQYFTEAVGVNGIFLAKMDGTAKGGIVLAISQELKLPILYLGTGQGLEDMVPFDAQAFAQALCSP